MSSSDAMVDDPGNTKKRKAPESLSSLEASEDASRSAIDGGNEVSSSSSSNVSKGVDMQIQLALMSKKDRKALNQKRRRVESGVGTKEDIVAVCGTEVKPSLTFKLESFFRQQKARQKDDRLQIRHVQQLLLWVLGDGVNPRWIFVKNKPLIEKVVFLMVDSLSQQIVEKHTKHLPKLASIFERGCPVQIPSSVLSRATVLHVYTNLTNKVPGFKPRKPRQRNQRGRRGGRGGQGRGGFSKSGNPLPIAPESLTTAALAASKKHSKPITHYLANQRELHDNEFPSSEELKTGTDFVCLKPRPSEDGELQEEKTEEAKSGRPEIDPVDYHLVALDCEMVECETEHGSDKLVQKLARCTVVDDKGKTLYDELCKPENIVDYCTKYSGITKEMLKDVTKTLSDVQADLQKFMFADTIVAGHSLENDFKALKLVHDVVLDSSILFPHPKGPPLKSALRHLVKRYLHREIQTSSDGHDSSEDAIAALDLINLKLREGPNFGVNQSSGETIFEVMARSRKPCTMVADPKIIRRFTKSSVSASPCSSDPEVVKATKKAAKGTSALVWSVMQGPPLNRKITEEDVQQLDAYISDVYESLPNNTMFVVATGQGMTFEATSLHAKKMKLIREGRRDDWSDLEQTELEAQMSRAEDGLVWLKVKTS